MAALVDYLPLVLFFVAFKLAGVYVATGVAIAATVAQIAWVRWHHGKVGPVHLMSLAVIVVFGGATLLLHDETFIKWKPTVLYTLFGLILAVGRFAFGKNLLAYVMRGVELPETAWVGLTWAWVAFFASMALANWYVAFHYSLDTWATFKVWGGIGLFLAFALAQGLVLARYVSDQPIAEAPPKPSEEAR